MRITFEFDKEDSTWVACLRKGAYRKLINGLYVQPIARVANGSSKSDAKRNLQMSKLELLALGETA